MIIWYIGILFVVGLAGDSVHSHGDSWAAKLYNYVPYVIAWPLILGQAIGKHMDIKETQQP